LGGDRWERRGKKERKKNRKMKEREEKITA
jgi:hypothetical protein